jgi:hypothetical protein
MENTPRPAYVQFEVRAVEDRTASLESGQFVAKDVIYAIVTPAGTKDRLEKVADEWLLSVEEGVKQERIPLEWLNHYRMALKMFKESREVPEIGTSVTSWPVLSPAQVKLCLDANLRTVEEVAEATEEAVSRLGMGARALKAKAQAWLDSANTTGKVSAELESLRTAKEALETKNADLLERVKTLETQLEAFKSVEGKK